MTAARGSTALFAALAVLVGLLLAVPRAHAVEEMRQFNKDDTKPSRTKVCPKGKRYSDKKRDCVKTSCGTGQVWSGGVEACLDGNSASLSDEDLYLAAGDFALEARYADALPLLFRIKDRNNPQVLNLIGYSTRKLGDVDKGIDYYHRALAIDPNYTKARQYLGEAYLLKDDVAKAKEQLMEIADRCGGPCDDYELLVKAIAAHVTGEAIVGW
ncbi:tetratricopeptide repeat protein [Methyloceanibacter sp.]|uniref:tetratricopeptide repeat protein n=1 Tax=Methyloceanibacter sp. TaxID=1965321 RepID=UPI003D6CAD1B